MPLQTEGTSLPCAGREEGQTRCRVLVTGANGQLGRALMALLPQAGFQPTGVDLPEVGGDAVAYCGSDAQAIARALVVLDAQPERRRALGAAALQRAAEFTWKASAQAHVEAYRAAMAR